MIEPTKHTEIVLTGGPSSGKTSTLAFLQEKLTDWGYRVLLVPEIATMVFMGGVPDVEYLATHDKETYAEIEQEIMYIQLDLRARYRAIADVFNKPCVIIYDRAEMDVAAYVPRKRYESMLSAQGLTHQQLRDSYDAVIHLNTVALADDAEYQKWTNPTRRENREAAIAADARTFQAWHGHPHLHMVDPHGEFADKQRRVLATVAQVLGKPRSTVLGTEQRFIADSKKYTAPKQARRYTFTQHFLRGSTTDRWRVITKRKTLTPANATTTTYYRGEGSFAKDGELLMRGRIITRDEWERQIRSETVQSRPPLVKERAVFKYKKTELEVDTYANGLILVTAIAGTEPIQLPDWIKEEITDNHQYQTVALGLAPVFS